MPIARACKHAVNGFDSESWLLQQYYLEMTLRAVQPGECVRNCLQSLRTTLSESLFSGPAISQPLEWNFAACCWNGFCVPLLSFFRLSDSVKMGSLPLVTRRIVFYLLNLHIKSRHTYFARAGTSREEDSYKTDTSLSEQGKEYAKKMSETLIRHREGERRKWYRSHWQ